MIKKKKMNSIRTKCFVVAFALLGFLWFQGIEQIWGQGLKQPQRLRFYTSQVGTAWYTMGGAMGDVIKSGLPPGSDVEVAPISGSITNIPLIVKGDADIAYTFSVITSWAWNGIGPYEGKPIKDFRVLLGHFDTYWISLALRAETGITSIEQIKDKKYPLKLCTGDRATIPFHTTRHIFAEYGMPVETLESWGGKIIQTTWPHIVDLIKDKMADGVLWVNTPGHPTWSELAMSRELNFLPLGPAQLKNLAAKYGYSASILPKGSFKNVSKDVPSLGFGTILITKYDKPDDVAYAITKAVCGGVDKLKAAHKMFDAFEPKDSWRGFEAYLHPGSEKFFREKNWK
jgi:TRAP transporter TAXI family solute receptor